MRTTAEMHMCMCECVARMCVSVSSRGQGGSAVGEGLIAYEEGGEGLCRLQSLRPGSQPRGLGFQASPKLLLGERSQLGHEAAQGSCPGSSQD